MKIKQFEIESLSHYSYAIISEGKMAVVDPQRNPFPYYQYAEENEAEIVVIFETHPHADFISGHLQISEETGADIYISSKIEAEYPHKKFDDGDSFTMGEIKFSSLHTPGHSPDSICIVAELNNEVAIFTGDTLFVGDVGRPDLREKEDDSSSKAEELAKMMYKTVQNKFTHLPDYSLIYPTHGAGSM